MNFFIPRNAQGFTIIELLIVFSVLAILSTVSVVSFVTYNKAQTMTNASRDIQQALTLAKSRAQSQVKPDTDNCKDQPLIGYEVLFCSISNNPAPQPCKSGGDYEVDAVCGTDPTSASYVLSFPQSSDAPKKLPKDVTFDTSSQMSWVLFGVLDTGVTNADKSVRIKDGSAGIIKSIRVDSQGNINEEL